MASPTIPRGCATACAARSAASAGRPRWTSPAATTSSSKARSAPARRASRASSRTISTAGAAGAARGESLPRALLRGHGALRAADATDVSVPAHRSAARRRAVRLLPPGDGRRLPARQGSAVRASQPDRCRIRALREGLCAAEARVAGAGPRDLPAGAGRDADRARAPPRRPFRAHDFRPLPRAPRRRVQPVFLPVRRRRR